MRIGPLRFIRLTLALSATLSPRLAMSQSEFVGTIRYDVVNKDKHIGLILASDGKRVRQDLAPNDSVPGAYAFAYIVDAAKGDLTLLMPVTRRYRVIPFTGAGSPQTSSPSGPQPQPVTPRLMATRRHERIAGVDCELFVDSPVGGLISDNVDEYCITSTLGKLSPLDSLISHSDSLSAAAPVARIVMHGGIVLRMRLNSPDSPLTMVATKIDRASPSPSIFVVPDGYERFP